jgi:hypothetical protein
MFNPPKFKYMHNPYQFNARINLKCSEEDKDWFIQKAKQMRMTQSQFARTLLFNEQIKQK